MTSSIGRFATDRCSRRIRSTSARLRVFPSIAFVPQVLSAPARFHVSPGRESRGARVKSVSRRAISMSCLIYMYTYHTTYLNLYGIRESSYVYHIRTKDGVEGRAAGPGLRCIEPACSTTRHRLVRAEVNGAPDGPSSTASLPSSA